MSAIITAATKEDIPQILEIVNHYIVHDTCIYDWNPRLLETQMQWFEQQQQLGNPVLVAKKDTEILGYSSYSQFRPKVGYQFSMEHSVYVHPDHHGKGIGKELLSALIQLASNNGVHTLIGGIDTQNTSSIAFHEQFGFINVGIMPQVGFKFDRWLDLVWMQKIL